MLKDRFAQYFRRSEPINFVYKGRPMTISIRRVLVYPQAYAAVIPQSSQLLKTLRVFVIDIGGFTTLSYEIYSHDIFIRLNESFLIEGNRNIMID